MNNTTISPEYFLTAGREKMGRRLDKMEAALRMAMVDLEHAAAGEADPVAIEATLRQIRGVLG